MIRLSVVRVYLEAKTKDELIKKQVAYNVLRGKWLDYSPILKDGRIYYVSFFDSIVDFNRITKAHN